MFIVHILTISPDQKPFIESQIRTAKSKSFHFPWAVFMWLGKLRSFLNFLSQIGHFAGPGFNPASTKSLLKSISSGILLLASLSCCASLSCASTCVYKVLSGHKKRHLDFPDREFSEESDSWSATPSHDRLFTIIGFLAALAALYLPLVVDSATLEFGHK